MNEKRYLKRLVVDGVPEFGQVPSAVAEEQKSGKSNVFMIYGSNINHGARILRPFTVQNPMGIGQTGFWKSGFSGKFRWYFLKI